MVKKNRNALTTAALFLALLTGGTPLTAITVRGVVLQDQSDYEWKEINDLLDQGNDLFNRETDNRNILIREKEDRSIFVRRRKVFRQAAEKFERYIKKYKKEYSVDYLIAVFRLGEIWELAGDDYAAKKAYLICTNHEERDTPQAVHNGEPLAPQITARLRAVNQRLQDAQRWSGRGQGGSHRR